MPESVSMADLEHADELDALPRWYTIIKRLDSSIEHDPDALAQELASASFSNEPFGRRGVDIVLSLLALAVSAPLLAYVAIAIRRDTPGPALFRQVRCGRLGRPFKLLKFRGMFVDARERFPHLYDYSYGPDEGRNVRFHAPDDPRVTLVGRRFRKTSVDELPNFWNVLRGEIAVVGPRPQIAEMFPYYGAYKDVVLTVKPGIFSLPKVLFRDDLSLEDTFMLDAFYVHRRSWKMDLFVLWSGVKVVYRRAHVH